MKRIELPQGWSARDNPKYGYFEVRTPKGIVIDGPAAFEVYEAFAAAMNRPTDGLRDVAIWADRVTAIGGDYNWRSLIEALAKVDFEALAATPQTPAAPPVLPSDEVGPLGFSESDMEAAHKALVACGGFMGLQTQQNVAALFAAHRTAHQNAAAPTQNDITGRQLFADWTESNGGLMKGGYGFLNPTAKREWEYCAQRINQASQSMRLALIRAFFTLEWISSRVDGIDQPAIEYRMKDITDTLGTTEGDLWDLGFSDDDMKGSQG